EARDIANRYRDDELAATLSSLDFIEGASDELKLIPRIGRTQNDDTRRTALSVEKRLRSLEHFDLSQIKGSTLEGKAIGEGKAVDDEGDGLVDAGVDRERTEAADRNGCTARNRGLADQQAGRELRNIVES